EANSDSSESDDEEEDEHLTEFQPYTVLEAFEAIGRLKATFKTLDPDKLIQVNEKLDFLEYEIQDSVVEQKPKDACFFVSEKSEVTRIKVPTGCLLLNFNLKKVEGSSTAEPCHPTIDMHSMEEDRFDVASLSSVSSFNKDPPDINAHLHSIKREIQLLTTHFVSLKQISQFLVGIFNMFETEDETIKNLLTKTLDEVKEFIFNLDDLEYSVTLVGNGIVQSGGASVMVWDVCSWSDMGHLIRLEATDRHLSILPNHLPSFIVHSDRLGQFQQDNATSHTSGVATKWLQESSSDFRLLHWPPKSQDMSSIEDIWDALLHAVEKRSPPPSTPMDLLTALQDSCCEFPSGYLQTLGEPMPRCFASLLHARGGPIRY
ncbi:hypothetical protein AVEN_249130-1, partial [Araneus ventricosus]